VKCPGSGFIGGGYIKSLADDTLPTTCSKCWREIDMVPIESEVRTDLRIDHAPVTVLRKRMIDHEFGNHYAMLWRRDRHVWLSWISIVFGLFGAYLLWRTYG
jgi:hypothetical protein